LEDLPLGSRGTRRAVVWWSDGSEGEALKWYADEILVCEGDLLGKTREQLRSLHFRRTATGFSPDRRRPLTGRPGHPRVTRPGGRGGWAGIGPPPGRAISTEEDLMATIVNEAGRRIALDEIRVPENVRALDDAHVRALAGSIKLQGMLVPVVVRGDGDGVELVAGFHRIGAARSLGLAEVPVVVRDVVGHPADQAAARPERRGSPRSRRHVRKPG